MCWKLLQEDTHGDNPSSSWSYCFNYENDMIFRLYFPTGVVILLTFCKSWYSLAFQICQYTFELIKYKIKHAVFRDFLNAQNMYVVFPVNENYYMKYFVEMSWRRWWWWWWWWWWWVKFRDCKQMNQNTYDLIRSSCGQSNQLLIYEIIHAVDIKLIVSRR